MKKIVIFGSGGFGSEAAWVLEEMNQVQSFEDQWQIIGFVDDAKENHGKCVYGYKVLGFPEDVAKSYSSERIWYICAIGDNATRENISLRLAAFGWLPATLIHPSVIMAKDVVIGEGTYVGAGSILCPGAKIGRQVLINTRVAVGHDSLIADYSQLCPGAQINGHCVVGKSAVIGSNASILPRKRVGEGAIVGSNSQVVCNIKAGASVNGVPAVSIK